MSQLDLANQQAVIVVFAMNDCPACENYLPRLVAEAEALREQQQLPFVVFDGSTALPTGAIPIIVYDAASQDPDIQKFADRFAVTATPTTLILHRGAGSFKAEGNLANNQIAWLLFTAAGIKSAP